MSNPPPWNDPIKPPNGNFSLEERKWREGITRGLNNIKIKSLGDIGDVDLTSPSANQILKFDGSNWVNGSPSTTVVNWGDIVGSLSNQTDLQNALNAKADLLSLALVATSGSYNDLSDKPTIPTVNDATLTIQKNGTNVATFTANASSNATANISVPTDTSDLTNTAGYITGISSINDIGDVTITTPSTGELLKYDGSKWINGSPSTSVTNWGDILGTLSNQTDLQNALNDKQDVIDANNKLDYSLLSNTPTIPTVNDATLTLQQNGTTVGTFTANASTNNTLNFTDTNTTSGITVNSSLVPNTDNTYNLGDSNSGYWANTFSKSFNVSPYCSFYVDSAEDSNFYIQWRHYNDQAVKKILFKGATAYPQDDNNYNWGYNDARWHAVWTAAVQFGNSQTINVPTTSTVRITSNGKNYDFGAGTGGNVSGSDERLKKNIVDMPDGQLDLINKLRPRKFDFKSEERNDSFSAGFIAQEIDSLGELPNLVIAPSDNEENNMYGIDYAGFVPYLVKAIQELSAKVTALENKLESLGV